MVQNWETLKRGKHICIVLTRFIRKNEFLLCTIFHQYPEASELV